MSVEQKRVARGTPEGGQFATGARPEPSVSLALDGAPQIRHGRWGVRPAWVATMSDGTEVLVSEQMADPGPWPGPVEPRVVGAEPDPDFEPDDEGRFGPDTLVTFNVAGRRLHARVGRDGCARSADLEGVPEQERTWMETVASNAALARSGYELFRHGAMSPDHLDAVARTGARHQPR